MRFGECGYAESTATLLIMMDRFLSLHFILVSGCCCNIRVVPKCDCPILLVLTLSILDKPDVLQCLSFGLQFLGESDSMRSRWECWYGSPVFIHIGLIDWLVDSGDVSLAWFDVELFTWVILSCLDDCLILLFNPCLLLELYVLFMSADKLLPGVISVILVPKFLQEVTALFTLYLLLDQLTGSYR